MMAKAKPKERPSERAMRVSEKMRMSVMVPNWIVHQIAMMAAKQDRSSSNVFVRILSDSKELREFDPTKETAQ